MAVQARILDSIERRGGPGRQQGALDLARRLPALVVAAKEIASSAMHGVHGRRRSGTGENFWQFRPFVAGDPQAASIGAGPPATIEFTCASANGNRRTPSGSGSTAPIHGLRLQSCDAVEARSRHRARLRRRRPARAGWEARGSGLASPRPLATRTIIERFAETMLGDPRGATDDLPPPGALPPRVRTVLISDFLTPPDVLAARIADLATRGARGHLLMIADPVEETFPFAGHTEFRDLDSDAVMRIGQAERFRDDYIRRLAAHRDAIGAITKAKGWSLAIHRTDRPASQALLALRMRLEQSADLFAAGTA